MALGVKVNAIFDSRLLFWVATKRGEKFVRCWTKVSYSLAKLDCVIRKVYFEVLFRSVQNYL